MEQANYQHQRDIADLRLIAEQHRTATIEAQKQAEEAFSRELKSKLDLQARQSRDNQSTPSKPWYKCSIA